MKIVDPEVKREAEKKVPLEDPRRPKPGKLTQAQIAAFWFARKRRQRRGGPAPT